MPTRIQGLVAARKSLSSVPSWVEYDPDGLQLRVPLEVDGVVIEGLTLRGRVRKQLENREAVFQLEYHHAQIIGGPVARIEWNPLSVHNNKGLGPKPFRHILQDGSHHHRFDLNWARSNEAVLRGELPIAVPLNPNPKNFRDLLGVVEKEFRIDAIQQIGIPPWEPTML
jgi:hypothetical protein